MWRLKMLGWALLALVAVPALSLACVVIPPTFDVGPNFGVKVENRGHPVEGLEVLAVGPLGDSAVHRAISDRNGVALFRNVPAGYYALGVATGGPKSAGVHVDPSERLEVTVPLKWPNMHTVSARSLKGTLRLPDNIPGQSQPSFSVALRSGFSGSILKTAATDGNGAFEFPGFPDGLYVLRLSSIESHGGGVISVAVEPSAATDHLDLDLGWTSCGLFYSERSTCPQDALHLVQLVGRVADVTGGSIPDAEILVFDASDRLVQRTRTDKFGSFTSHDLADGTYQLVILHGGFTPLRRTLTVDSEAEGSRLVVELGLAGACTEAQIQ